MLDADSLGNTEYNLVILSQIENLVATSYWHDVTWHGRRSLKTDGTLSSIGRIETSIKSQMIEIKYLAQLAFSTSKIGCFSN